MGLDSVELIMTMEKTFNKEVPDPIAESIYTVGDATQWFYDNIKIKSSNRKLQNDILSEINHALKQARITKEEIFLETPLRETFPSRGSTIIQQWSIFQKQIALKTPQLPPADYYHTPPQAKRFLGMPIYTPIPSLLENNVSRLVECIGALNYKELVDFDNISSLFEVFIIMMSITEDRGGVDINEVYWDSSFINDLGFD